MLPCGSVAVGREDRQPGRRRERDGERRLPGRVGRHLQRAQVILQLAGPARPVAGAGEDLDEVGRVRLAARQRPSYPAAGGGAKIGKFWKSFGPWRGEAAFGVTPSSPRSMACPVLAKIRLPVIALPMEHLPVDDDPRPVVAGDEVARDADVPPIVLPEES